MPLHRAAVRSSVVVSPVPACPDTRDLSGLTEVLSRQFGTRILFPPSRKGRGIQGDGSVGGRSRMGPLCGADIMTRFSAVRYQSGLQFATYWKGVSPLRPRLRAPWGPSPGIMRASRSKSTDLLGFLPHIPVKCIYTNPYRLGKTGKASAGPGDAVYRQGGSNQSAFEACISSWKVDNDAPRCYLSGAAARMFPTVS